MNCASDTGVVEEAADGRNAGTRDGGRGKSERVVAVAEAGWRWHMATSGRAAGPVVGLAD